MPNGYVLSITALLLVSTTAVAMTPGNMPADCRGQAASVFATKPVYPGCGYKWYGCMSRQTLAGGWPQS